MNQIIVSDYQARIEFAAYFAYCKSLSNDDMNQDHCLSVYQPRIEFAYYKSSSENDK